MSESSKQRSAIWKPLALGTIVAAALLVTVVLPAEYGIDPTGLGKLSGLNALAAAPAIDKKGTDFGRKLSFNVEEYDVEAENIQRSICGLLYLDEAPFKSETDAPDYPEGFEQAYSKGEGTGQNGSFTAPFPGYHGWYFMNLEEGPAQIELTVSGYYTEHKEMYRAVDGKVLKNVEF